MSKELEILEDLSKEEIVVRDRSSVYMNPNDNGKGAFTHLTTVGVNFKGTIETIKQALLKAQELKSENNALLEENKDLYFELALAEKQYKELIECNKQYKKVLEIIWEKKVDLYRLHFSKTLEDYNTYIMKTGGFTLTQEEFNLLKRYFR